MTRLDFFRVGDPPHHFHDSSWPYRVVGAMLLILTLLLSGCEVPANYRTAGGPWRRGIGGAVDLQHTVAML